MATQKYKPRGICSFYIPTDTPQNVLDFLNELGETRTLSRELLEIVRRHLDGEQERPERKIPDVELSPPAAPVLEGQDETSDQSAANLDAMRRIRQQQQRLVNSRAQ